MSCYRLRLNWDLESRIDRTSFIHDYLNEIEFKPNSEELEMMSKYILWGKTPDGELGRKEKLGLTSTQHVWDSTEKFESLEALLEHPSFSESSLRKLGSVRYTSPKPTFSRAQARKYASPDILEQLEIIWRTIDVTELIVSFYDLYNHKRTKPIRESLLNKFTFPELEFYKLKAQKLKPYQYLQHKHLLVDLRQEQYTFKDTFIVTRPSHDLEPEPLQQDLVWEEDIIIKPLGLPNSTNLSKILFNPTRFPEPNDLTLPLQQELTTLLWTPSKKPTFDFTNPLTINTIIEQFIDLEADPNLKPITEAFTFYRNRARLKPIHNTIIDLKINHTPNQKILDELYTQYKKKYNINYLSTLYHQNIIKKITAAAQEHREIAENLFFPENFKTCIDCGRSLLATSTNFTRKAKSIDGLNCRCKECERIKRLKK